MVQDTTTFCFKHYLTLLSTKKNFKLSTSTNAASAHLIIYEMFVVVYVHLCTWLKYCRYGVKHDPINQSISEIKKSAFTVTQ